tara:strand:- start:589 stop:1536 length:948 start_codon:yes stop_codon:yes gene_type:complete
MKETYTNEILSDFDDEINLREIFDVLIQGKWIIVSITTFITIIGIIYSLLLPNIYQSTALLVPVEPSSSISGSLGDMGGLASLAGISLPSSGSDSNATKAINKLRSLSFFENNILPHIFLPDLMALKSWDYKTNTLVYDPRIYNKSTNTWVRDYSYPEKQIPSAQESFKEFAEEHIIISKDKKTGFITLSIKHESPFLAKQWAELVIREVNTFYRQKDKSESQKSISYLNSQIAMTSLSEIKQVIAQLMQKETQKLTLIEANQFYVFDYIDPPAVMEEKAEPQRGLICILSMLLGMMLSIIVVLIRHYGPRKEVL